VPEYVYKAIKTNGQMVEGVMSAAAESELLAGLREQGLLPIQVSPKQGAARQRLASMWRRRSSSRDRLTFGRQLATLVRAGIPLDRSLALCRDLAEKEPMQELIQQVLKDLRSGKSLAASLSAAGNFFPPLYIAMVRAGEASGTLAAVLDRLVEFEEFSEELRNYLISAMIYPSLLVVVGGAAITLLLGFVVPRFAQVFEEAGRDLPLPTWILMQVSNGFRSYGWAAALLFAVALVAGRQWVRTEAGRMRWDSLKLRAPVLGPVWRKLEVSRFSKTLGTLLGQAVPIVPALRLTHDVLGNRVLAASIEPLVQGVKRGQGLAAPLKAGGQFPPMVGQMVTLGEETGKLDSMLLQVADVYDREVRTATKRLMALVEPAVILVMGLIVGAIVVSTLLAIVSINEVPL